MTLTIGRGSFGDPTPRQPITQSGNGLSLSFDIRPSTLAEAKIRRQQVLGLVDNPDEPVVPVTWSADPDFDGFYRVLGASVEPTSTYLTNKLMRCRVELERVGGGYANPMVEVVTDGAVMTNAHGLAACFVHMVPSSSAARDYTQSDDGSDVAAAYAFPYASPDVQFFTNYKTTGATVNYYPDPATAYQGACMIETLIDSTWYPLIGRQVPSSAGRWRLSNGFVRVTLNTSFKLDLEAWDHTTANYVAVATLEPGYGAWTARYYGTPDPDSSSPLSPIIVLRNSPESVVIRVAQRGNTTYPVYNTFALRLGAFGPMIEQRRISAANKIGMGPTSAIAMTDSGWGGIATSADANGNKLAIATPVANDVDTVNGRVTATTASNSIIMLPHVHQALSTASGLVRAHMTGHAIWRRVVAR